MGNAKEFEGYIDAYYNDIHGLRSSINYIKT
jgi:hypothetical protein